MEKCSICNGERDIIEKNEFFPFCSLRCKMVDLGRWLNEEYFIPSKEVLNEEAENDETVY